MNFSRDPEVMKGVEPKGWASNWLDTSLAESVCAQTILGLTEPKWDAVALVRYLIFAALRKVKESPLTSRKRNQHRKAALEAWEFIATFQPEAG